MQATRTSMPIAQAASEFLKSGSIAVTGVSRSPADHGSNTVYCMLRERGFKVFAVNPNADRVEGDPCFHDLRAIPGGVSAVVIGTSAQHAEATMRECAELGIKHVWMHRSVGPGSMSESAARIGREQGISVIPGGCPLMFEPVTDGAHKVMRFVFSLTGAVSRKI